MTKANAKNNQKQVKYVDAEEIHPDLITYTEHQTSTITGFAVKTLRQRRWTGKAPRYLKMGSIIRYRECDLLRYLDQSTVFPRDEQ